MTTVTIDFVKAAEAASRSAAALIADADTPDTVRWLVTRHAQARRKAADIAGCQDLTAAAASDLAKAAELLQQSMIHLVLVDDREANAATGRYLDGADQLIACARMLTNTALSERLDRKQAERDQAAAVRAARTPEELAEEDVEEVRALVRVAVRELLRTLPGLNRFKRVRNAG
ncbi:hypothetical protein [Streptomyces sp. NRRL S-87]|uniref:hypothetical protein n=1 Tax=Streptomyces sp. NRRL S-87 TaxID=1463920 RepID=UPI0004BEA891|nr:hypothetical protein [Streptomyces sp. NRRL S-87]